MSDSEQVARYARLQVVFAECRTLPERERELYLERLRESEPQLAQDLARLLEFDGTQGEHAIASGAGPAPWSQRAREDADAATPEYVGPYRIIRELGVGGMGRVYEAQQTHPRRSVALKLMRPGLVGGEALLRFRREGQVLARLQHPGIAQVFELGAAQVGGVEQPFMVMELVAGAPLIAYAQRSDLDRRARLELLAQVCDAVQHAHERGVVHRDLKPDNVLVDERGRAKVLDFGIARVASNALSLTTIHTADGALIGTLTHMAPEQLGGDAAAVGPATDVYALGVIAFELLTERLPHEIAGLPIPQAIRQMSDNEAPRLGTLDRSLRGDLETIVDKALATEPGRRYVSAAALASDLRRHLDHQPIVARPPSAFYRAAKFSRRHRELVGGVVLAVICLLIGVISVVRAARVEAHALVEAEKVALDARAAGFASLDSLLDDTRARADSRRLAIDHRAEHYAALQSMFDRESAWAARTALLQIPESERGWEWRWLEARGPLVFPGLSGKYACWHGRWLATVDEPRFPAPEAFVRRSAFVVDVAHPRAPRRRVEGMDGAKYLDSSDASGWAALEGLLHAEPNWPQPYQGAVGILDIAGARFAQIIRFADRGWYGPEARSGCGPNLTRVAGYQAGVLLLATDTYPMKGTGNSGWSRVEVRPTEGAGAESSRNYDVHIPDASYCRISPDGEFGVVYPSFPGGPTVVVRLEGWQELRRVESLAGLRASPQFRPDGTELACLASGTRVDIYSVPQFELKRSVDIPNTEALRWLGTDRWLLGVDDRLRIVDAATSAVLEDWAAGFADGTPHVRADSQLVALGAADAELVVFAPGPPRNAPNVKLSGHDGPIHACAWSPDGSLLASAAPSDPDLLLWDGCTGELVGRVPRYVNLDDGGDRTMNVAAPLFFSNESTLITTETHGTTVRLVTADLATGERWFGAPRGGSADWPRCSVERIEDLLDCVDSMCGRVLGPHMIGHPDGQRVICASSESTEVQSEIRVRGRRPAEDVTLDAAALGLALSPDQQRLAVGGDQQVRVVSFPDGSELANIKHSAGVGARFHAVAWSPDGDRLAAGSSEGRILIIETQHWRTILELPRHTDCVLALAWSPDGARLASASADKTLRIYDTEHPIARKLQAEELEKQIAIESARLEALVNERRDEATAARALLAEARDDVDELIAARRACLLRNWPHERR